MASNHPHYQTGQQGNAYSGSFASGSAVPYSSPLTSASSFSGFPSQPTQQHPHHQQNYSPQSAFTSSPNAGFAHRRAETNPTIAGTQMPYFTSSSPSFGIKSEDQYAGQVPMSAQMYSYPTQVQQFPVATSRSSAIGTVRIHQFFPTSGEIGVPVTFLITVKAGWARDVGLQLVDGRYGGSNSGNRTSSSFLISFGGVDVETRTERSMSGIDSPLVGSFIDRDLDLTVIAHVPAYPGSPLSHPQQGGKVPLRIKLVGNAPLEPSLHGLTTGFEIGEFTYWEVSPRSNLKRAGEHLFEEPQLRRPASFPNFATTIQASTPLDNKRSFQQLQHPRRPVGHLEAAHQRQSYQPRHQRYPTTGSSTDQNLSNEMAFNFNASANITSPPPVTTARYGGHPLNRSQMYSSPGQEGVHRSVSGADVSSAHPQLIRSSQLYQSSSSGPSLSTSTSVSNTNTYDNQSSSNSSSNSPPETTRNLTPRASLEIHGNIQDMALGWSHDEWRSGRRLIQFWRKQEGATIHAICRPIQPEQYIPNSIVVSCIFWEVTNECYITSVDIIYLLEALVASRFTVEEKNRIRRNLEGLKPKTISKIGKNNDDRINKVHEEFFKLVMGFPDPRPRHIEKDIKIFPWRVLSSALNKIISKYSAAPAPTTPGVQTADSSRISQGPFGPPSQQQQQQQQYFGQSYHQAGGESQSHSTAMNPPEARRAAPPLHHGLSIDVNASNSAYHTMQQQPTGSSSSSTNQYSAASLNLPSASPRRPLGSASAMFNFSDFVVSPSAFGQTPLQQSQQSAGGPPSFYGASSSSQQQQQQHHPQSDPSSQGGLTGLGMDLGSQRREQ